MRHLTTLLLATALPLAACGGDDEDHDHDHDGENPQEVITTVTLTFEPEDGGGVVTAAWDDADGPGGDAPVIDPIVLVAGTTYSLAIGFENRLEDPPEIITEEISDEGDEHQIFLIGTAVDGPASDQEGAPLTHTYDDEDGNGLPIGLENTIVAAAGTGEMTLVLRHLPPVNDQAVKVEGLAEQAASDGISELPGDSDVQVDFDVTVE